MARIEQVVSTRSGTQTRAERRQTATAAVCDFCGRTRTRDERNRLVWEGALATRLVLAELCSRCAPQADSLLELHGGHGRDLIRLVQEIREAPAPRVARHRVLGFTARGILYLLIALAAFLIVTLVTSRAR